MLGWIFEFTKLGSRRTSRCSAIVCDLAVFLADAQLHLDIWNDLEACHILAQYYQVRDAAGVSRD